MTDTDDLDVALTDHADTDHRRGCAGRCYSCSCGYDARTEELLRDAAHAIKTMRGQLAAAQRENADLRADYRTANEGLLACHRELQQLKEGA